MDSSNLDNSYSVKIKKIRSLLKQFDLGEKRQWPAYLSELSRAFDQFYFGKNQPESTNKLFDECKRVFTRVLTTKLFNDIIKEIVICLTSFSTSLEHNCNFLFNWMFSLYNSSNSDDTKLVVLKSLVKIIDSNHKGLNDNLPSLLNKTIRAFESTDSSDLLIGFIEVFLAAAKTNPKVTVVHFQNVVDIIIGWHVNSPNSSFSISTNLSRALIGFKQFWVNDINFSTSLLNQFVDDYENLYEKSKAEYLSDLKSSDGQSTKRMETMTTLVKIYIVVLKSLNQFFRPDYDQIVERLKKFVNSVINLNDFHELDENLIISVNDCALYVLNLDSNLPTDLADDLIRFLNFQFNLDFSYNELFNISTIKLSTKLITSYKNLPTDFISKILNPDSNFQRLRFLPSKQIMIAYNELIHNLLGLKSIPLLEETYKCILNDLQTNLTSLLKIKFNLLAENLVDYESTIQSTILYPANDKSEKNLKLAVSSSLISLSYFCTSKQSMFSIWCLKPTFFDLLTNNLQPTIDQFTRNHQDIHYLIVYILYVYCKNHQNYLSTSTILTNSSTFKCSYAESTLTNNYLIRIFRIIIDLLKKDHLPRKTLMLCLNWFKEIFQSGKDCLNLLCKNDLFYKIIDLIIIYAYFKQPDVCLKCCEIIELIIISCCSSSNQQTRNEFNQTRQNLKNSTIKSINEVCIFHLTNSNLKIKKSYVELLSYLPLKSIMINELSSNANNDHFKQIKSTDFCFDRDLKLIKKQIMKHEPSNLFSSISFRTLMSSLSNNNLIDDDLNWLKRILHLSYNFDVDFESASDQAISTFSNQIDLNSETLYFWALWEITQYCILNKLKTPLGKPQDTFTKIENMIRQNASYLIQQNVNTNQLNQPNQNHKQFQIKLLLQLMENLEKLLYNASNSSSLMLCSRTPNVAKTFFTTNKNTCIEWINRNRIHLMMIALKSGDPGIVWRNGELLLLLSNNLVVNKSIPVENVLVILIAALIDLNEYNYIVGLHKWCLKKFENLNFDWMIGAIEESKGRYEKALIIYIDLLETNYQQQMDSQNRTKEEPKQVIYQFLIRRILECFLNLGKNQELIEFYTKHNVKELSSLFSINFDLEYINWFEDVFDLKSNLSSWKSFSYERADSLLNWDTSQTQHRIEKKLIFAANSLMTEGENLQTLDIIKNVYQLASSTLISSNQCGPNKINNKLIILQKIAQSIKMLFNKNPLQQQNTYLDQVMIMDLEEIKNLNFDCSTLIFCIKWLNVLERLRCKTKLVDNPILPFDKLYFLTAKSARKQGKFLELFLIFYY